MINTDNNTLDVTIAQLRELLTWPDGWNGYNALAPDPNAVSRAEQWITEVYQYLIDTQLQWIAPNITAGDGDVVFCWHHEQRSLYVYIENDGQSRCGIMMEDGDIGGKITDGYINTIEDMQHLWQWLLETTQDEE